MGYLILPTILLVIYAPLPTDKSKLADFGRLGTAVDQQVVLVDVDGVVHEGVLRAASSSAITMQFGSTYRTFQNGVIASVDRRRDRSIDGAIKGAIVGLIWGAMASQGANDESEAARIALYTTTVFTGIGYAIDASQSNRQPLYLARFPQPPLKVSLRF